MLQFTTLSVVALVVQLFQPFAIMVAPQSTMAKPRPMMSTPKSILHLQALPSKGLLPSSRLRSETCGHQNMSAIVWSFCMTNWSRNWASSSGALYTTRKVYVTQRLVLHGSLSSATTVFLKFLWHLYNSIASRGLVIVSPQNTCTVQLFYTRLTLDTSLAGIIHHLVDCFLSFLLSLFSV